MNCDLRVVVDHVKVVVDLADRKVAVVDSVHRRVVVADRVHQKVVGASGVDRVDLRKVVLQKMPVVARRLRPL